MIQRIMSGHTHTFGSLLGTLMICKIYTLLCSCWPPLLNPYVDSQLMSQSIAVFFLLFCVIVVIDG